ncbi:MAG: GNA1162 family protein [Armatimonadota bacterium]
MKMRFFAKWTLVAIIAVSLISGCKDGGPSSRIYVKNGKEQRLRIAVLPFDNVSRDQDAGRIITNTIITYLLSTGNFDVVEPGVVYSSMTSEGMRLTEGVTMEVCQKLQPKLNADAFIMGLVEEYGEVRIGSDSYPSVSFSARLVDAKTADILWAATISKTGADNVRLFDIGRVSSLGKLSKQAVSAMAVSLAKSSGNLATDMGIPLTGILQVNAKKGVDIKPSDVALVSDTTLTSTKPGTSGSPKGAQYLDESANYGEQGLTSLLKDVGTAKLGEITYKKHFHDTIETKYKLGEQGKTIEVKLVDYLKPVTSGKFLEHYNLGLPSTTFESLSAYEGDSDMGYHHLDVAVGRFGLFLRGPKDNAADIEALGKGIIALLK